MNNMIEPSQSQSQEFLNIEQYQQQINQKNSNLLIKDIIYNNCNNKSPFNLSSEQELINQVNLSKSPSSSVSSSSPCSNIKNTDHIQIDLSNNCQSSSLQTQSKNKKTQKKKTTQITSEIDEERTSQLVSEILKNIKEKTKELESLNQNLKSTTTTLPNDSIKSLNTKLNFNLVQTETDFSKSYSNDSSCYNENSNDHFYDSESSSSKSNNQKKAKKTSRLNLAQNTKQKTHTDVPQNWTRLIDQTNKLVSYISPTGTVLKSIQDVRSYLLSNETCKCGLECPLNIYEIFNFNPSIENANKRQQLKSLCSCKHVNLGQKKKNNFVKILDEVNLNQNLKRASDQKVLKVVKKVRDNNNSSVYFNQESQLQSRDQSSILISNIIDLGSKEFNQDLLFHAENFTFNNFDLNKQHNQQLNNSITNQANDSTAAANLSFNNQEFNDICQLVNNNNNSNTI